jgi:hypothetical protein
MCRWSRDAGWRTRKSSANWQRSTCPSMAVAGDAVRVGAVSVSLAARTTILTRRHASRHSLRTSPLTERGVMRQRTSSTPGEAAPPAGARASTTPHPELPTPSWNVQPPPPRRASTRAAPTWAPPPRSAMPGRTITITTMGALTERSLPSPRSRC